MKKSDLLSEKSDLSTYITHVVIINKTPMTHTDPITEMGVAHTIGLGHSYGKLLLFLTLGCQYRKEVIFHAVIIG
jgi:hypothetical protein